MHRLSPLLLLLLVSCDKMKDDLILEWKKRADDKTKPVINLTAPTLDQHYPDGSVVTLDGTVTDNYKLDSVIIVLSDPIGSDEPIVLRTFAHGGINKATFDLNDDLGALTEGIYQINVRAKDVSGNVETWENHFNVSE